MTQNNTLYKFDTLFVFDFRTKFHKPSSSHSLRIAITSKCKKVSPRRHVVTLILRSTCKLFSVGDTSVGDTSVVDTSVCDTSVGDTSVVDTSEVDISVGDTSVGDTSPFVLVTTDVYIQCSVSQNTIRISTNINGSRAVA